MNSPLYVTSYFLFFPNGDMFLSGDSYPRKGIVPEKRGYGHLTVVRLLNLSRLCLLVMEKGFINIERVVQTRTVILGAFYVK